MKDILNNVLSELNSKNDDYCSIKHKKGWFNYLRSGDLGFTSINLHLALKKVIDRADKRPRGNKLLFLRNRDRFTVMSNKIPYRKEEALERFITASNDSVRYFNQIPIGGGKESIDIGIKETESRFIFVELKPWSSTNSPLYAIVESLKNLIEYRIIKDRGIEHYKEFGKYNEVDLMILAPLSYYRDYGLNNGAENKIGLIKKTLNDLSSEFRTKISLMILPINETAFDDACRKVCDKYKKTTGQEIIYISSSDAIPELKRDQWKLLVSTDVESYA